MWSHIIKKAVKLLEILVIISSIPSGIFGQGKHSFNDSTLLKKELDSVLAKHGLKSKGFSINVVSINQSGGQTAYSITNNYYSDPSYIPDSLNFEYRIENQSGKKTICFYPKRGSWNSPFILHDTSIAQVSLPISGMHTPLNTFFQRGDGMQIPLVGENINFVCTKLNPLCITLNANENPLIVFGDYGYNERNYLFINGHIYSVPMKSEK